MADADVPEGQQAATIDERVAALEVRVADLEEVIEVLWKASNLDGSAEGQSLDLHLHKGVLWHRLPDGTFEQLPYCPKCQVKMRDVQQIALMCPKCKEKADFKPFEVNVIRAGIKL